MHSEEDLEEFIQDLDRVIMAYHDRFEAHNIAGMLLSRVALLMTSDPETGKGLLMFVWRKLDELEQSNPGQYL